MIKPPPEYKGINKDNEELNNLLERFQAAANSKEYHEAVNFDREQLKQEFLEQRSAHKEPLEAVFESSNEITNSRPEPIAVQNNEASSW